MSNKKKKNNKGAGANGQPDAPAPGPVPPSGGDTVSDPLPGDAGEGSGPKLTVSRLPAPPSEPLPPGAVKLNPVEKLAFDNLMLEKKLLEAQLANLQMRRDQYQRAGVAMDREAESLNAQAKQNEQARDDFVAGKGFDPMKPVAYVDGIFSVLETA